MSGWGGGYVTDITYMTGWYRQQSPVVMSLAAMLGGVAAPLPGPDDPVQYLELGCGQGNTALLLAASNPGWHVTAVDFNPAHVVAAREWAAEAGLTNVTVLEADLSTLVDEPAGRAIPEADFVSMHGLWSWVPPSVRSGIVRLLKDKVRSGGLVHASYNALPAWGATLGMQRLLRSAGRTLAWRSDRQAEEGLKFLRELNAAEALQLRRSGMAQRVLDQAEHYPVQYLAHEYMNDHWSPCFMADVATDFADARLDWVASCHLVENFPDLTFTEEQRKLAQKFDDPLLRELIKDMCVDRMLRHDVFVRGARRVNAAARDAALFDVSIGLNIPAEMMPLEADMPAGRAQLSAKFYQPIVQALRNGPRRVRDLLELPDVEGKRDNPAELVGILVGLDIAEPALRPNAEPHPATTRFNRATARRMQATENLGRPMGAATYRLGTGMSSTLLDMLVVERTIEGDTSVDALIRSLGHHALDETKLRDVLEKALAERLPVLRAAGVF